MAPALTLDFLPTPALARFLYTEIGTGLIQARALRGRALSVERAGSPEILSGSLRFLRKAHADK